MIGLRYRRVEAAEFLASRRLFLGSRQYKTPILTIYAYILPSFYLLHASKVILTFLSYVI